MALAATAADELRGGVDCEMSDLNGVPILPNEEVIIDDGATSESRDSVDKAKLYDNWSITFLSGF